MSALLVFLGGGTGAVLRYLVALQLPAPLGTFAVNVVGSALLAALLHPASATPDPARLAFGTGLLGGFTTYSTFNHEVLLAAQDGAWGRAAAIVTGTLVGCLVGGAVGWSVAGWWRPTP